MVRKRSENMNNEKILNPLQPYKIVSSWNLITLVIKERPDDNATDICKAQ